MFVIFNFNLWKSNLLPRIMYERAPISSCTHRHTNTFAKRANVWAKTYYFHEIGREEMIKSEQTKKKNKKYNIFIVFKLNGTCKMYLNTQTKNEKNGFYFSHCSPNVWATCTTPALLLWMSCWLFSFFFVCIWWSCAVYSESVA